MSPSGPFSALAPIGGWGSLRCLSSPTVYQAPKAGAGIHVLYEVAASPCDPVRQGEALRRAAPMQAALRLSPRMLELAERLGRASGRRHGTALPVSLGMLRAVLELGALQRAGVTSASPSSRRLLAPRRRARSRTTAVVGLS